MNEYEAGACDDNLVSPFDDIDIDTISLFQSDLAHDCDLDSLLAGCDPLTFANSTEEGSCTGKNSTLVSLLKPHPLCAFVPPAPEIRIERNSVIETATCPRVSTKVSENETYPQLKNALIQEKIFDHHPKTVAAGIMDTHYYSGGRPMCSVHDPSPPVAVSKRESLVCQQPPEAYRSHEYSLPADVEADDPKSTRRSPHNAIEKRYRQSINGKINELRELLNASSGDDTKTNKSAVLRRAIDRIRYLEKENECLRMQLNIYENGYAVVNDIDEDAQFGIKPGKGRLVRIKADPITPHKVDVLRPRQSLVQQLRSDQQSINSWNNQSSHFLPLGSSDEGSSPPMIGVPSTVSSTSDDTSATSSPESCQFNHSNRKRNADAHLFQSVCPSGAKIGVFCAPSDGYANDDSIQPPFQSFPMAVGSFKVSSKHTSMDSCINLNSPNINGTYEYQSRNTVVSRSESNFTRLSLFWGSFSLLMFNPFVISSSNDTNRGGAQSAGMPILRLLSVLSLSFEHSKDSSTSSSTLGPLFLSLMYAAQWIVAILLLFFAWPRNLGSLLPRFLTVRDGKRKQTNICELPGGRVALMHWKQSQEYTLNGKWNKAGHQLKLALNAISGSPHFEHDLIATFRARASAYFEGFRFAAYRLPQLIWLFLRRSPIPHPSRISRLNVPTESQLRRQLLDLKLLDLVYLSNNESVFQECSTVAEMSGREFLHVVHLIFSCLNDFVVNWVSANSGRSSDLAELVRLGFVSGLSVKRFFGINWLGNMLLRATHHLTENLNDDSVLWLGTKNGPIMEMLLAPLSDDFCRKRKVAEETISLSSLRYAKTKIGDSSLKSLAVDEVYHELCEAIIAKALECIVSSNLEPTSPFECYLKDIKHLMVLLSGGQELSNFTSSHHYGNAESNPPTTGGASDSQALLRDDEKGADKNFWWLLIIKQIGRWYAGSLHLADVTGNDFGGAPPLEVDADAQLIFLAYDLLCVTQSKTFNTTELNAEERESMLLKVWTAVGKVFDLLERMPIKKKEYQEMSLVINRPNPRGNLKEYFHDVYLLVAQDWILRSLNSIAKQLQNESIHEDDVVTSTSGCCQRSLSFNNIMRLFSFSLERQRVLVRYLQAPKFWLTGVEAVCRQLSRGNPVWTSLTHDHEVSYRYRCGILPPEVKVWRPDDGGEQPIFTCQAHVFTINPSTRRSWVQSSSKAVDINIFYDSSKQCYRIVSVEDCPTGVKVVINSTITPRMVFKQTSQKFGQWADPKSSGVFGLGFDSEADLNKFVAQFRQCVEATKQTGGESTSQGATKQSESHPSTLKNGQPVLPGTLIVGERNTLSLSASPNPPLLNTLHSGNGSVPVTGVAVTSEAIPFGGNGHQLMHHQHYQEHIHRLERELEAVRRQVSKNVDSPNPSSPLRTTPDGVDLREGLERVHIASPDGGSGVSGGAAAGSKEGVSLVYKMPFSVGGNSAVPAMEKVTPTEQLEDECTNLSESSVALTKLHDRLGRILQEACDLHRQIGHLLAAVANQST